MILDDFLIKTNIGFYCKYADVYIDPQKPVNTSIVSHAHADHACAGSNVVYCTAATEAFMKLRYKQKAARQFFTLNFHQSIYINGVEFIFIPAGHILGSAQILMRYKNISYLYSGDIKLQVDHTVEQIKLVKADVLITECTFAHPQYVHPDPTSEIKNLGDLKSPLIIGTYILGKAQRLNYLINSILPNTPVYIHYDILAYHKIYENIGQLKFVYSELQKRDLRLGLAGIYLVPPLTYQSYRIKYPYKFAFASGWDHLQNNGQQLKISDHMDWIELQKYIEAVNPTEIWAIHGDSSYLSEHFKNTDVRFKTL